MITRIENSEEGAVWEIVGGLVCSVLHMSLKYPWDTQMKCPRERSGS